MSDEIPSPTPVTAQPAAAAPRHAGVLTGTVIAFAAAFALIAWEWYDTRSQLLQMREEVGRRLQQADLEARESRVVAKESSESAREVQAKLALLEGKVSESQSQQLALEQLYQDLSRGRDEWVLAEIEQTLTLASQQLQLAGNVQGALVALATADSRLARSDRPQFIPLRKIINRDIERLKALPAIDIAGLTLRLDELITGIESLPLLADVRVPAVAEAESDPGVFARVSALVWGEIKQLVRVQRLDAADHSLLSPEQTYFVRENLKLKLMHARIALLQRNEGAFKGDVKAARAWIDRYFDRRQKSVSNALGSLVQLGSAAVQIELPTLADSLHAVRTFKLAGEKNR